jgi:hypothetical protein
MVKQGFHSVLEMLTSNLYSSASRRFSIKPIGHAVGFGSIFIVIQTPVGVPQPIPHDCLVLLAAQ